MAITAAATVTLVKEKFPQAVVEIVEFRDEQTIVLGASSLLRVCTYLQKTLRYDFLSTITAVDWPERAPRFDVVYQLLSLTNQAVLRLKVRVGEKGEEHPAVPSVTS